MFCDDREDICTCTADLLAVQQRLTQQCKATKSNTKVKFLKSFKKTHRKKRERHEQRDLMSRPRKEWRCAQKIRGSHPGARGGDTAILLGDTAGLWIPAGGGTCVSRGFWEPRLWGRPSHSYRQAHQSPALQRSACLLVSESPQGHSPLLSHLFLRGESTLRLSQGCPNLHFWAAIPLYMVHTIPAMVHPTRDGAPHPRWSAPPALSGGSSSSTSSPTLVIIYCLIVAILMGVGWHILVVLICFPVEFLCWTPVHKLIGQFEILTREVPVQACICYCIVCCFSMKDISGKINI